MRGLGWMVCVLVGMQGCATYCTMMMCIGTLEVTLDGALSEGVEYTVTTDATPLETCRFTLPLSGNEGCVTDDGGGGLISPFIRDASPRIYMYRRVQMSVGPSGGL